MPRRGPARPPLSPTAAAARAGVLGALAVLGGCAGSVPARVVPAPPTVEAAPAAPRAEAPAHRGPGAAPAPVAAAARPAAEVPAAAARPAAEVPAASTLDLTSLETRLRGTPAIGVFTKLSLKNQVDDLLGQFRAFYQGRLKGSLAELRAPFERLLLKVLSLLQDGDPGLAKAIVASREALWRILADPASFAALAQAEGETR